MNKKLKVTLIVLASVLVLVFVAGVIVGNVFFNLALDPHSDKSSVLQAPHNILERAEDPVLMRQAKSAKRELWYLGTNHEDAYITSDDGLRLHAEFIFSSDAQSNKWAILCHGYGGNATQMRSSAKEFYDRGFSALMPDARSLGKSEGDYIGMGWPERLDMLLWIDEIIKRDPDAQIVLYGISMGGATVMMTAGEDLPQNVKAIVEDCGYSSVWDEFSYQLKELFGLPAFPVINFSSLVTKVRAGYSLGEASAVQQLAKAKTPILFFHGADDTFVPAYMLEEVYAAADVPKKKVLVPGAGHGGAGQELGDEYWDIVMEFINQYMN